MALCIVAAALISSGAAAQDAPRALWLGDLGEPTRTALAIELQARGVELAVGGPVSGATRLARAAGAAQAAAGQGASAALWIEPAGDGRAGWICIVGPEGNELAYAALPGAESLAAAPEITPASLAVIAADLLDELRSHPADPPPVAPLPRAPASPAREDDRASTDRGSLGSPSLGPPSLGSPSGLADPTDSAEPPSAVSTVLLDFGLNTSGVWIGLELGVGVRVHDAWVIGAKAWSIFSVIEPGFVGALTGGVFWLDPDDEVAFDAGLLGGVTVHSSSERVTPPVTPTTILAAGWTVDAFVGVSVRTAPNLRLWARIGGGAASVPVAPDQVVPVLLLSLGATVGL